MEIAKINAMNAQKYIGQNVYTFGFNRKDFALFRVEVVPHSNNNTRVVSEREGEIIKTGIILEKDTVRCQAELSEINEDLVGSFITTKGKNNDITVYLAEKVGKTYYFSYQDGPLQIFPSEFLKHKWWKSEILKKGSALLQGLVGQKITRINPTIFGDERCIKEIYILRELKNLSLILENEKGSVIQLPLSFIDTSWIKA